MWDIDHGMPLSHDPLCQHCHHPLHTYLPCSDHCDCESIALPGAA